MALASLARMQQVTNFNARRRLMEMLDVDGTATISYPEFIAAMTVPWWIIRAARKKNQTKPIPL